MKYDAANDSWQQKASFSAKGVELNTSSFSINNYGYIIGDLDLNAYNNFSTMKLWSYNASQDQWQQFSEDYPGQGAYGISTVSLSRTAYVGLGFNNADFNATDLWSFK